MRRRLRCTRRHPARTEYSDILPPGCSRVLLEAGGNARCGRTRLYIGDATDAEMLKLPARADNASAELLARTMAKGLTNDEDGVAGGGRRSLQSVELERGRVTVMRRQTCGNGRTRHFVASRPRSPCCQHITLKNGFDLICDHRQADGDRMRLYLDADGTNFVDVARAKCGVGISIFRRGYASAFASPASEEAKLRLSHALMLTTGARARSRCGSARERGAGGSGGMHKPGR